MYFQFEGIIICRKRTKGGHFLKSAATLGLLPFANDPTFTYMHDASIKTIFFFLLTFPPPPPPLLFYNNQACDAPLLS
jgi:hypothetical protein